MGKTDMTTAHATVMANMARSDGRENDIRNTSSDSAKGVNLNKKAIIIPTATPIEAKETYSDIISAEILPNEAPINFLTAIIYVFLSI